MLARPHQAPRSKYWSAKLIVVCLAIVLPLLGVARNAATHAPVHDGTVEDFWLFACQTALEDTGRHLPKAGGTYPPQESWGIYYLSGYHDQLLLRVPLLDLASSLPKLESAFKQRANEGELQPWLAAVARQWNRQGNSVGEVRRLLSLIREANLARIKANDEDYYEYKLECEVDFLRRWQRAKYYWLTLTFEIVWLSFVLLFATWPFLRNSGWVRWAIHSGMTLPLLFLPFFLGYTPLIFSSAFPAGGVFYPYVLLWFRGLQLTDFDFWFFEHAPQPFGLVTQHPGPMMAITGSGLVGPSAILGLGIAIAACTSMAALSWRCFYSRILPSIPLHRLRGRG